jgi:hypothetical protein
MKCMHTYCTMVLHTTTRPVCYCASRNYSLHSASLLTNSTVLFCYVYIGTMRYYSSWHIPIDSTCRVLLKYGIVLLSKLRSAKIRGLQVERISMGRAKIRFLQLHYYVHSMPTIYMVYYGTHTLSIGTISMPQSDYFCL